MKQIKTLKLTRVDKQKFGKRKNRGKGNAALEIMELSSRRKLPA